jgi:hypothetical protein
MNARNIPARGSSVDPPPKGCPSKGPKSPPTALSEGEGPILLNPDFKSKYGARLTHGKPAWRTTSHRQNLFWS